MGLPIEWFKKNTCGVWYDSEVHLVILILGEVEDEGRYQTLISAQPNEARGSHLYIALLYHCQSLCDVRKQQAGQPIVCHLGHLKSYQEPLVDPMLVSFHLPSTIVHKHLSRRWDEGMGTLLKPQPKSTLTLALGGP